MNETNANAPNIRVMKVLCDIILKLLLLLLQSLVFVISVGHAAVVVSVVFVVALVRTVSFYTCFIDDVNNLVVTSGVVVVVAVLNISF